MKIVCILSLVLAALASSVVRAEFSVIVHPSTSGDVSKDDIARIFLAKSKKLPDGSSAKPVNLDSNAAARAPFESNVLGKSPSQVKAYWSRLIFTGKAVPIEELGDDADVVARVASTPGAIGYVDSAALTDAVRVVLVFE